MGKAELTAPWGGQELEGGEGAAGGSCGSSGEDRIFAVGEVEVISVREWGVAPPNWASQKLSSSLASSEGCSVPLPATLLRGLGLSGGECTYVGAGKRASQTSRGGE